MGAVASTTGDLNPMSIIKSVSHDVSVFICNSCKSQCNFCGCWTFAVQTFETHDDKSDDGASLNIAWHQ